MANATTPSPVRKHMEVVCSEGRHVGTVDHLDGDEIKLTRKDSPDNRHHFIPLSLVESVDDRVHLSMNLDDVVQRWRSD